MKNLFKEHKFMTNRMAAPEIEELSTDGSALVFVSGIPVFWKIFTIIGINRRN